MVAIVIGIPIGILSAVRPDGVLDFFARSGAILGLSVPGFVQAIVVILLPAIWWGWTPLVRFTEFAQDPAAYLLQFVLPAIILGIASAAAIMRLTRGMLLEVLRQDYVRTAWAKGLRERVVVLKHSLKNAIIPVVTVLGLQIAQIAGGSRDHRVDLRAAGHGPVPGGRDHPARLPGDPGHQPPHRRRSSSRPTSLVDLFYAMIDPRIRY